jgi:hypothetical protein
MYKFYVSLSDGLGNKKVFTIKANSKTEAITKATKKSNCYKLLNCQLVK